ncbi:hypothetical protein IGS68_24300 [Skermanella sp. TT6]|uniref:Uncharacterized protein n=1 Tax=Skermanella cutis TaxID=2775420 RepID=A0ABX7B3Z7_9PROT|nr:hypothetical protein [Skermanella sp. TT6]QQP89084.1 hypothetical protein IGS68_24300 [Skermanella sp. TT6]
MSAATISSVSSRRRRSSSAASSTTGAATQPSCIRRDPVWRALVQA